MSECANEYFTMNYEDKCVLDKYRLKEEKVKQNIPEA